MLRNLEPTCCCTLALDCEDRGPHRVVALPRVIIRVDQVIIWDSRYISNCFALAVPIAISYRAYSRSVPGFPFHYVSPSPISCHRAFISQSVTPFFLLNTANIAPLWSTKSATSSILWYGYCQRNFLHSLQFCDILS